MIDLKVKQLEDIVSFKVVISGVLLSFFGWRRFGDSFLVTDLRLRRLSCPPARTPGSVLTELHDRRRHKLIGQTHVERSLLQRLEACRSSQRDKPDI